MASNYTHRARLLGCTAMAAASLLPAAAWAQDAAVDDSGGLEEIIVTAQKREQSVQDVPIAVTAVTAGEPRRPTAFSPSTICRRSPRASRSSLRRAAFQRRPSPCAARSASASSPVRTSRFRSMSTASISPARAARSSSCPISSGSKCCAARKARCSAATPPPARSASPPAIRPAMPMCGSKAPTAITTPTASARPSKRRNSARSAPFQLCSQLSPRRDRECRCGHDLGPHAFSVALRQGRRRRAGSARSIRTPISRP